MLHVCIWFVFGVVELREMIHVSIINVTGVKPQGNHRLHQLYSAGFNGLLGGVRAKGGGVCIQPSSASIWI